MGDYNRSTREMSIADFPPEMLSVLQAHIEQYNLGLDLKAALICVEARSEKIKKGLFSGPGPKSVRAGLVLLPGWLFEALAADDKPPFARSVRLDNLVVEEYEKSPFYTRLPDSGVHVTGLFTAASESGTSFIGLGRDAAGEKFKQVLIDAVQNAKK